MENKDLNNSTQNQEIKSEETPKAGEPKKKMTLADLKVKSFISEVKVEQMQFLKTAGG